MTLLDGKTICATHPHHETVVVPINLAGQPIPSDYPAIPPRLARRFDFEIFNAALYRGTNGYCTGDDELSRGVGENRIWEGYETLAVLDLLSTANDGDWALDFGSQLGWYSVLAAAAGCRVRAYEADAENVAVAACNAERNGLAVLIDTTNCWIDSTFTLEPLEGEIGFVKSDLEGLDQYAIGACMPMFADGRVRFLLIEISPVFNDSYPQLVEDIAACGYRVYEIPDKGFAHQDAYGLEPLATLREHCELIEDRPSYVASLRQANFLFERIAR